MNAPDDDPLADALRREMSTAAVPFDAGRAEEMIHAASAGDPLGARTWQAPLAAAAAVVVVGGGAALVGTHVGSGGGTVGTDAAGCGPTAASSSAAPGSTAPITPELSATPVSSSAIPSSTVAPTSSAGLPTISAEPCADSVATASTSLGSRVIDMGPPSVAVGPARAAPNAIHVLTLHATGGVRADEQLAFGRRSYRVDGIQLAQTAGTGSVVQIGRWPANEPMRPGAEPIVTVRPATLGPDGVRRSINLGKGASLSFGLRCPGTTACTVRVTVFGHTVDH